MRRWGLLVVLLVLSACSEARTLIGIEADAYVEVTIPTEVAEQYGMLQLEKKLGHLDHTKNNDGSVTFSLNPQEVEQLEQSVKALFAQYEQAIAQEASEQVRAISYDAPYKNIHFYIEDEAVIHDENFLLTEELLVKQALTYQLIHGENLGVAVLYYDKVGAHILSKKTIPIQQN